MELHQIEVVDCRTCGPNTSPDECPRPAGRGGAGIREPILVSAELNGSIRGFGRGAAFSAFREKWWRPRPLCQGARGAQPPLMVIPPSTGMFCPVIHRAPSPARKSTSEATSSGSPTRPSGVLDST